MKKITEILPGFLLAAIVASIAKFLEGLLPVKLIGASVIALFIGMLINHFWHPTSFYSNGLTFTSKKILKFAIILLGASLNISMVLQIGKLSLTVMIFTLLTCFGMGYFVGKALHLNWKLSNLISAGTGICGGSAIAALAPVIDADDIDIAYAMSATFLFDIAMIILFPIMGKAFGLSNVAYGLWAGTAVNDTSSVVAAGYAFSEAAGDFATMVKLTRTLSIIPTVIIFSIISNYLKNKELNLNGHKQSTKLKLTKIFPWFILGFLLLSALNSTGIISENISLNLKDLSKFLMISALAAIGLNTSFKQMKKSGVQPMIHGFIISALVVIVALLVEFFIGLI